jgi:hypothetical protein
LILVDAKVFLNAYNQSAGTAKRPLTMDAHLAALAQEYGASICSFDSDFKKFPGVRLVVS